MLPLALQSERHTMILLESFVNFLLGSDSARSCLAMGIVFAMSGGSGQDVDDFVIALGRAAGQRPTT